MENVFAITLFNLPSVRPALRCSGAGRTEGTDAATPPVADFTAARGGASGVGEAVIAGPRPGRWSREACAAPAVAHASLLGSLDG
jgi:hypothetical protein